MTRSRSVSTPAGLTNDLLVIAWHAFDTLNDTHPLRLDFAAALWTLEDAIDTGQPVDAAPVAVVQFIAVVSA